MKVNITLDTEELKVPHGWEVVGVRVAKRGEYLLTNVGPDSTWNDTCGPVVVVRKSFNIKDYSCTVTAEEIYGKDFRGQSGYEVVDFRCPHAGELLIGKYGIVEMAHFTWDVPRFIVKKIGE